MTQVTIFKPDGNVLFQNVSAVEIVDGALRFDWRPDSTSYGYKRITTTCPYYVEETFEGS